MGFRVVINCDGCAKAIEQVNVERSNDAFMTWATAKNLDGSARQANPEVFCDKCMERAIEFWESKSVMMDNCLREMRGRVEKHKNKFWVASPKSNLVVMK